MPEPAHKQWYKTSRWQRLRWSVLVAAGFTCSMCGKLEGNTRQLVADHDPPHRGDEAAFWDPARLKCLCKPCHDGDKQALERGGKVRPRVTVDGWPEGV
jgi:5-methylcytosine-specific restriction endonuclease McrA